MHADILVALVGKVRLRPDEATGFLNAFASVLRGELAEGRDMAVFGLGSFKIVETAERKGVNPRTGGPIVIPAGKKVRFVPSRSLRDAVNRGQAAGDF
ncbi:MAG: HU family DNA-binding protein [Desulfovibrionaceae bacterium]|nr:HU family DNA-binding protein [Desulfovibrionaceae bacterium]MBR5734233.1 HU family DNA-binding protein [Desulfovibrionaceae bacterium]